MPLYEFECPSCRSIEEAQRRVDERHTAPRCASCGQPTLLAMSAPLVVFRGDGWSSPTTQQKLARRSAEHTARGHQLPPKSICPPASFRMATQEEGK